MLIQRITGGVLIFFEGKADAFVMSVGSAHCLHGVTKVLLRHNPKIHIAAVEPADSAVLSGRPGWAHQIEGIGIGFVPPLWEPKLVDELLAVSTDDARAMTRQLAKEEGLFAGTSSGANVVGALRLAKRLGSEATVISGQICIGCRSTRMVDTWSLLGGALWWRTQDAEGGFPCALVSILGRSARLFGAIHYPNLMGGTPSADQSSCQRGFRPWAVCSRNICAVDIREGRLCPGL
jgi:hypothetical protein